jgi:MYXO-CTERM domain-containing protein
VLANVSNERRGSADAVRGWIFSLVVAAVGLATPGTATAQPAVAVSRGPYLQAAAPDQITVRWRLTPAAAGRVRWGKSAGMLTETADDGVATDHSVTLTGLLPATRYYYSVGTPEAALSGGQAGFSFLTPPAAGTTTPTRLWVLGDSGTGNDNAAHVRDAFLTFSRDRAADVWLMLGDNAYERGTDEEYQRALFDFFPTLLPTTALWPAIGNADVLCCESNPSAAAYFQIFSPPAKGQAGGVASGSPLYYSFDHGDLHVVVLDSMVSSKAASGPMLTWLRKDLEANDKLWLVSAWHHPPYTAGEHDSDFEQAHVLMRQNALPILEEHGVDLVLGGHSHSYERSFLLDGHYGSSDTLTAAMKKDPGTGRPEETGAYRKASGPHQGAVYVVQGNAGQVTDGPLNHPAMVTSQKALGSLVVDIDGPELRATFLRDTGEVADHFVIQKMGTVEPPPRCDGPCPADGGADAGAPLADASADAVSLSSPDAASDGMAAADGGVSPPSSDGCGCALGGARPGSLGGLALVMLALLLARRRR